MGEEEAEKIEEEIVTILLSRINLRISLTNQNILSTKSMKNLVILP
jgi:hypothetical protein